jgi:hypothetical protein
MNHHDGMKTHITIHGYSGSSRTDPTPRSDAPEPVPDEVRKRSGWFAFIRKNLVIPAAFGFGIVSVLAVLVFTKWLAGQSFQCPAWTTGCHVRVEVATLRDSIGTVQGIVTAFYSLGIAALAFVAHTQAEAAIWPLLNRSSFTIRQIDTYLEATRGSILSTPSVLLTIKTSAAAMVLAWTALATLVTLSGAPLLGYVYQQPNTTTLFESRYSPGGGIARIYAQNNPPSSVEDGVVSFYTAWSRNISAEPMSEYRDWYVDRKTLASRGNMTVQAVRMKKSISCQGTALQQIDIADNPNGIINFSTNMASRNGRGQSKFSNDSVQVRTYPALAVWADDFVFQSTYRTSATLIFGAMNGTIDGGITTPITDKYIAEVSAIKCNIDIEFVNDTLRVGSGRLITNPSATLSSVNTIHIGHCNSTNTMGHCLDPSQHDPNDPMKSQPNTLNENILWFTMAPILAGLSVSGTQPMFYSSSGSLPLAYTSTNSVPNTWTIPEITHFVDVAIGAVAVESSTSFRNNHSPVTMLSTTYTKKLDPNRPPLLLIPLAILLLCIAALAFGNILLHRRQNIPFMRLATMGNILQCCQTSYIRERVGRHANDWNTQSSMGDTRVKYGVIRDVQSGSVLVGFSDDVLPFGWAGRRRCSTGLQEYDGGKGPRLGMEMRSASAPGGLGKG